MHLKLGPPDVNLLTTLEYRCWYAHPGSVNIVAQMALLEIAGLLSDYDWNRVFSREKLKQKSLFARGSIMREAILKSAFLDQ